MIIVFAAGITGFKAQKTRLSAIRTWTTIWLSIVMLIPLTIVVALPLKTHIKTSYSPDRSYEIDVYMDDGGAAVSPYITAELDGPLWFSKVICSYPPTTDFKM